MQDTKDIIMQLKQVRDYKHLSYGDILKKIEANGDYPVAKSTLSRVFADGSEEESFNYESTIRPIANALLDMEEIEEGDSVEVKAIKSILRYKIERIEELEKRIDHLEKELLSEKDKAHEKLDEEREEHRRRTDFLINQIALKDKRMDQLLEAVFTKDSQHKELLDTILDCPARKQGDCNG